MWTDSGKLYDERQIKHLDGGESRIVPGPPELVALLQEHLRRFGTDHEGRVFTGERGGAVPSITYERAWRQARQAAFTAEVHPSLLARRPYDLRHAAVSTWLNSGVPAPQVAEWAGHSVAVLLEVYPKCLEGGRQAAMNRVEAALGWDATGWGLGDSLARIWREQPKTTGESRTQPDSGR
jgi:integrase